MSRIIYYFIFLRIFVANLSTSALNRVPGAKLVFDVEIITLSGKFSSTHSLIPVIRLSICESRRHTNQSIKCDHTDRWLTITVGMHYHRYDASYVWSHCVGLSRAWPMPGPGVGPPVWSGRVHCRCVLFLTTRLDAGCGDDVGEVLSVKSAAGVSCS